MFKVPTLENNFCGHGSFNFYMEANLNSFMTEAENIRNFQEEKFIGAVNLSITYISENEQGQTELWINVVQVVKDVRLHDDYLSFYHLRDNRFIDSKDILKIKFDKDTRLRDALNSTVKKSDETILEYMDRVVEEEQLCWVYKSVIGFDSFELTGRFEYDKNGLTNNSINSMAEPAFKLLEQEPSINSMPESTSVVIPLRPFTVKKDD